MAAHARLKDEFTENEKYHMAHFILMFSARGSFDLVRFSSTLVLLHSGLIIN